jgi:hypothetical protein
MPKLWWGVITVRLALEAGTVHHEGVAHVLLLQRLQSRLVVNAHHLFSSFIEYPNDAIFQE